jgi:Trk K+ transport system NAD-binding subunit
MAQAGRAKADKPDWTGNDGLSGGPEEFPPIASSKQENHVIVLGYKLLGIYVVEKLTEMGLPYVVIVRDESQLPALHKSHIPALASPIAKSFETLKAAGASRATAIIATFDDDGDNLLAILNAKKINPGMRAITVINDKDMAEAATASGADIVIAPYELTGQLLALSTVSKGISAIFVKGSFKSKQISQFVIDGAGKASYPELNKVAPIVMVSREGKTVMNPHEEFGLERGDIIYAVTDGDSLVALEKVLLTRRMVSSSDGDGPRTGGRRLARLGATESFTTRLNDLGDLVLYGPLSIIRHIWIQIMLLAFMFGFGTAIFSYYQHLNLLTAFLGSVSTITTIGIYNPGIIGMAPSEQVLLAITFIVSVGLAASVIQGIVTSVTGRETLRERSVTRMIGRVQGHVIVAGYNYLGKYAVEWLDEMKVDHVIITVDPSLARSLQLSGELAIHESASRPFQALREAGAHRASTLVCALDDDGDNLLVAMSARKQSNDLRILTVVTDRDLAESAKASSDIDVVFPIFDIVASILAFSAIAPEVVGIFIAPPLSPDIGRVSRYVTEFVVGPTGRAMVTFKALNEVAPVLLVVRNGEIVPHPDDEFQVRTGDSLLVMTPSRDSIEKFRAALATLRTA